MKKTEKHYSIEKKIATLLCVAVFSLGMPLPAQAVIDPYEPQMPVEVKATPTLETEKHQVDIQTEEVAANVLLEPAVPKSLTAIEAQERREAARNREETDAITLEQAITMALKESAKVGKAGEEVDKQWEMRAKSMEDLKFYSDNLPTTAAGIAASQNLPPIQPVLSAIMDEMDPMTEIKMGQAALADSQYALSKLALTSAQDKVVLATADMYWQVLKNQQKVNLSKINLEVARQQMQNSRLAYQMGLVAHIAKTGAETQFEGARVQLETAQNELDRSYAELKQQLGIHQSREISLTDKIPYQPLPDINLETAVGKVLESAPEFAQAKEMVTLQSYVQDMAFYGVGTTGYRPYEVRKIEVRQAALTVEDTRKLFENITRNIYYGLRSLEEGYKGVSEKVKVMEEALKNKQLMYQQGMITLADLNQAEAELATAKYDLFELAYRHAVLELSFARPWAAGSASSAP